MDLTLRFSTHPSEDVLEAYALNRLPGDQIPEIETHLLVCEKCQRTLADLDVFVTSMKSALVETTPVRVPPQPLRHFPAWQAAAAVCVLTGAYFLWDSSTRALPSTVVLSAMRGSGAAQPTAPANAPLELNIASTAIDDRPGFRIEIVTSAGDAAWGGPVTRSADGKPLARVDKRLSAGSYWVRLYSPDNQLLQEFGLRLN